MAVKQEGGVTAVLTVLVPRDDAGTLEEGVLAVLERIDRVQVRAVEITGLTPRLNDMAVEVSADVAVTDELAGDNDELEGDPTERAAAALGDGFGVTVEGIQGGPPRA